MTTLKADSYASIGARERYVPRGLANTHSIFVERAEGTRLWDVDGKQYLDFTSGIGVLNTGHRHPQVVRAVHEQLDRLMHTCFQVTMYEPTSSWRPDFATSSVNHGRRCCLRPAPRRSKTR
jgi:4-aminobutyrate aminotransferase-like enzyme